MATPILMPKMSFVVDEATILEWLKQPGDEVTKGEPLLEVESEKATVEIESPGTGILGPELAPPDTTVPLTTIIGYLLEPGETSPKLELFGRDGTQEKAIEAGSSQSTSEAEKRGSQKTEGELVRASPSAKRLAREKGVELAAVEGTGPKGRITEKDVIAFIKTQAGQPRSVRITPLARKLASDLGIDLRSIQGSGRGGRVTAEDVKIASLEPAPVLVGLDMKTEIVERTTIQRITAERMTFSFQKVPHFYLNVQINMSRAVAMREALLPSIEAKAGVRLSFSDILVGAVAHSLRAYPDMHVSFENDQLKRLSDINVGLAIDTARGLVAPVFYKADQLSLAEIASRRVDVIERANQNRLTPDDMGGGTFTISNLGMFGIDSFSAIVNPPQAAILAVGRITKQAVVVDDALQIQPAMWMTLSVDHRAVDGAGAARFLQHLVRYLEEPYKMLV